MSKSVRVKATEYGEQQLEALGLPAVTEFELKDGSTVKVLSPFLWDDTIEAAVKAAGEDGDESYNVRYAKAVLGTKEHARFIKGGGKSTQVQLAVEAMRRPSQIVDTGSPDPKEK